MHGNDSLGVSIELAMGSDKRVSIFCNIQGYLSLTALSTVTPKDHLVSVELRLNFSMAPPLLPPFFRSESSFDGEGDTIAGESSLQSHQSLQDFDNEESQA